MSGYVLAGGESARMQVEGGPRVDKALLKFDGATLLERSLRTVAAVCGSAAVLGGPPARCGLFTRYGRVVPDSVLGCGPLGGLHAALVDAAVEWVLITPVDLPLLPVEGLVALMEMCCASEETGVGVMRAAGYDQPLPVVLHRTALRVVVEALGAGELKLMPVLRRVAAASARGLMVLEGPVEWLANLNTPGDLVGVLRQGPVRR